MRRLVFLALLSCAPDDPQFGDPHGIQGRQLPGEGNLPSTGTGTNPGSTTIWENPYDAASGRPTITVRSAHLAKSGPVPADGLACLTCHVNGGLAAAKIWSFGGRVVRAGNPVADAEILVVSAGTKLGPVKSDVDGFFWFSGTPLSDGAKTYARLGANEESMSAPLTAAQGSCAAADCHVPGKQGNITVR